MPIIYQMALNPDFCNVTVTKAARANLKALAVSRGQEMWRVLECLITTAHSLDGVSKIELGAPHAQKAQDKIPSGAHLTEVADWTAEDSAKIAELPVTEPVGDIVSVPYFKPRPIKPYPPNWGEMPNSDKQTWMRKNRP